MRIVTAAAALGLVIGLVAGDALAQKSKDLLRMPIARQISTSDPYVESGAPNRFLAESGHDNLVGYDESTNKVTPLLAKSWTWVDDKTLDFDLRDDVTAPMTVTIQSRPGQVFA